MQTKKFLAVLGIAAVGLAPVVSQAGPDTEEQAKMREALRRALEDSNPALTAPPAAPAAPKPVATPTVVVPVEPEKPVAPVVKVTAAPTAAPTFTEVPGTDDDEAAAKLRAALRQTIAEQPAAPAAPVAPAKPAAPAVAIKPAPAPVKPTAQAQTPGRPTFSVTPSEKVPSPFSAAKQQRLDALLSRYKADAITPQEYHAQRAAIIAAP